MSVATELTRLQTAKANIKTSIENKGVTVSSSALLDAYPALIDSISTGGVEEKLLNFIDFDGTIVASYDGSEIAGLSALPDAPDHTSDDISLTFDEWNWTLAEIKAYNTSYADAIINVGANYHTTDGKIHLLYNITSDYDTVGVRFTITGSGTVDWGDGSSAESFSSGTISHIYSSAGLYDCTITTSATSFTCGDNQPANYRYWSKLIEVRLPSTITKLSIGNFFDNIKLNYISIPSSVSYFGQNVFRVCPSIKFFTVPRTTISYSDGITQSCSGLSTISLPKSLSTLVTSFSDCHFRSFTIPEVTTIGSYSLPDCFNLIIPNTVINLSSSAFYNCRSIQHLVIPSSVTSIGNSCFWNCYSMVTVELKSSTPPTLESNSFNTNYLTKIYVPYSADHSVLAAYQAATNWSTYASIMEELPE